MGVSPFSRLDYCYCVECRKAQGGAFVTNCPVPTRSFHVTQGTELLAAYRSSPAKRRFFCSVCGSPIYSAKDETPEVIRLRMGTLDTPIEAPTPVTHIWTCEKPSWFSMTQKEGEVVCSKGATNV